MFSPQTRFTVYAILFYCLSLFTGTGSGFSKGIILSLPCQVSVNPSVIQNFIDISGQLHRYLSAPGVY